MTAPAQPNSVCPRCQATQIEVHCTSPVAGVWTVFGCTNCFYAWRSTEPAQNTRPDQYPPAFRLTDADLARFDDVPAIKSPPPDCRRPGRR
jgi:hypothetical protein